MTKTDEARVEGAGGLRAIPSRVVVVPAMDGARWDRYIESHPAATSDHLWGWRTVFDLALGHDSVYLQAERDGQVTGVLPLVLFRSSLFGRSVISLPYLNYGGVVADDAASGEALVAAATVEARRFRASHVELRHLRRTTENLPVRQHKLRLVLPLPRSPEELWASMDRKIRNQVRKAEKEGLTAEVGGLELVPEFYDVFAQNMRDLGTPVYPRALFMQAVRVFPGRATVHVVRHRGRSVAAGVSLQFRETILNPWASSLREFRHLCPNMLLYWAMLQHAMATGATVFDFGRSSPGGGTHQFKRQWGAQEEWLNWEYVLLTRPEPPEQGPSNPRFTRVIELWKQLPLSVANVLGPVLAHHIP